MADVVGIPYKRKDFLLTMASVCERIAEDKSGSLERSFLDSVKAFKNGLNGELASDKAVIALSAFCDLFENAVAEAFKNNNHNVLTTDEADRRRNESRSGR